MLFESVPLAPKFALALDRQGTATPHSQAVLADYCHTYIAAAGLMPEVKKKTFTSLGAHYWVAWDARC